MQVMNMTKSVSEDFEIHILDEDLNFFVQNDLLLIAEIFENFRDIGFISFQYKYCHGKQLWKM